MSLFSISKQFNPLSKTWGGTVPLLIMVIILISPSYWQHFHDQYSQEPIYARNMEGIVLNCISPSLALFPFSSHVLPLSLFWSVSASISLSLSLLFYPLSLSLFFHPLSPSLSLSLALSPYYSIALSPSVLHSWKLMNIP